MEANIYVILPPNCIEFPHHLMVKIVLRNNFCHHLPLHCETQAAWENLFFTLPMIKLKIFGGYISIIGASTEAETQVISSCTLFSGFSLISYENAL